MRELVIVGNGFDRYHGLPTFYFDYRAFLGRTGLDPALLDELCGRYAYSTWDAPDQPPWSNVEEALNLVWDDIVSESIDDNPVILTDDNPDWVGAEVDLDSKTGFLEQLTGSWLRDWVDGILLFGVRPLLAMPSDAFYVTFNYTDTLETVYGLSPDRILHIHGSRLNPSEPLQFGYPGPEPAIIEKGLKRDFVDESDIYSPRCPASSLPLRTTASRRARRAPTAPMRPPGPSGCPWIAPVRPPGGRCRGGAESLPGAFFHAGPRRRPPSGRRVTAAAANDPAFWATAEIREPAGLARRLPGCSCEGLKAGQGEGITVLIW